MYFLGKQPTECVLKIDRNYFAITSGGIEKYAFDDKWKGSECRDGDRIGFEFNFENSKCMVYYNDEVVGNLSESLPNQVHIAFTSPCKMTVATTKFKAAL